jgi:polysaccharide export outer membrane protein
MQFRVNVLGEVKAPGTYNFPSERVTILDAISAAGDLTDDAQRGNVMVIREENNKRNYYPVDLRSGAVFQSPVFQLQQNDLVYVGANKAKLTALKNNPNAQRNISLGISLISLALLVYNIIKTN